MTGFKNALVSIIYFCSLVPIIFSNELDEPLVVTGLLIDTQGNALEGGKVQIWQTDTKGRYDHPISTLAGLCALDDDFQYFGTATTGVDGNYTFTTIRPGDYVIRPQIHIHVKVFWEDVCQLTTQFYFSDDDANLSSLPDDLILTPTDYFGGGKIVTKNIVLDRGGGGNQQLTSAQEAGPFYPVVDFFDKGPNLVLNDRRLRKSGIRGRKNSKQVLKALASYL